MAEIAILPQDGLQAEALAEVPDEVQLEAGDELEDDNPGEVVYDSILLNKQKTKSYWEQLMMAAATPEAAPASPGGPLAPACPPAPPGSRDLSSLDPAGSSGSNASELSEQDYFDARSQGVTLTDTVGHQVSLSSPPEPADADALGVDERSASGPKIVETVAKKLESVAAAAAASMTSSSAVNGRVESVVERDIRLQREREEQLAREREVALQHSTQLPLGPLDLLRDDGFVSIPTTDEGNFSEYGSEEKELSIDGSNSRVMSPEVGALPHHHHQRTQSMDSTSSGHSSGSGSGSATSSGFSGRRRVTVKPLAEPEDHETPAYIRTTSETPIEREIRLTREREAELAREKALRLGVTPTSLNNVEPVVNGTVNGTRDVVDSRESVRNATNRIQQEISRANEREHELRHCKESPQRIQNTPEFPDRVKQLKKAVSTSHLPTASLASEHTPISAPSTNLSQPPSVRKMQPLAQPVRHNLGRSVSAAPLSSPSIVPLAPMPMASLTLGTPRRFAPNPNQKGLMQRFLASRGKMNPAGLMSNGSSSGSTMLLPASPAFTQTPSAATASQISVALSPVVTAKMASMADSSPAHDRQESTPMRRGYTSAEDKIQEELKEMRRREEELRLQRARTFARSQPNLLSILDDVDGSDAPTTNGDVQVVDKLPAMAALRSALSNPNLLDEETATNGTDAHNDKQSHKNTGVRKKNALIAQWENRIQQHIEH